MATLDRRPTVRSPALLVACPEFWQSWAAALDVQLVLFRIRA
jgi:hypothetical protein